MTQDTGQARPDVRAEFPGARGQVLVLDDLQAGLRHGGRQILHMISYTACGDGPAVRDYLTDRLASYKHPKDIRILHTLPRSGIGKIQKTVLRDEV